MANVNWNRPEHRRMLRIWSKIRDVIDGESAIKGWQRVGNGMVSGANGLENIAFSVSLSACRRYLPQPNPDDKSPENNARYRSYVERAPWYGATARTLNGMTGQVFQRKPDIKVPDEMKPLLTNIDGSGVTIEQMMTRGVDDGVAYGRAGLLADMPPSSGELTVDDIAAGKGLPIFTLYAPWQIINWRVELIDGRKMLTLVVLLDPNVFDTSDPFESVPVPQYRVLRMNPDGSHTVEIWREQASASNFAQKRATSKFVMLAQFSPLDANGKALTEIPFTFIGAKNNDAEIDKAPMEDLAETNITHYRYSADYADAVHMLGQPTPYAAGLTEQWVNNIWKGKVIPLGSRALIPMPVGGTVGLLQVAPNSMVRQAVLDATQELIQLGAKLMEQSTGAQTATGELIDETSETSVLSNVATNVAAAFVFALKKAALFMGIVVADGDIAVTLNTSFQFTRMSAGDRAELVAEWQKGAVSWTEMRTGLRATGVATLPDDDAKAEIAEELADAIATGTIATPFNKIGGGASGPAIPPAPPGQAPNPVPPAPAKKQPPKGK
jgi:hypothetical protein